MSLSEKVEHLINSLDEEGTQALKRSIRLKETEPLPDIQTLTDICTPTYIGPTWQTDDQGWSLPEKTLGWELAAWCSAYLMNPQDSSKPWEFTPEQLRFFLHWYAVDERGKHPSRRGVLQRLKGWG